MGVFLEDNRPYYWANRLPHARGGVSSYSLHPSRAYSVFPTLVGVFHHPGPLRSRAYPSSPRSWGCFFSRPHYHLILYVFPTLVGVFLLQIGAKPWPFSLPHARGGVSIFRYRSGIWDWSSPRSWGCFLVQIVPRVIDAVFPTLVGVFPRGHGVQCRVRGLPHARGGVSLAYGLACFVWGSSPRSWGCFPPPAPTLHRSAVFPTLVGVFPPSSVLPCSVESLPHARGGVSL